MNFKDLKKQSSLGSLTEKLLKEAEKMGAANAGDNPNLFKLETDKAGNGRAVIRFLPAPQNEDLPFVKLYNHGFQVNNRWFIENCPTTLGEECCVCSLNGQLWNSGLDSDKEIARARKRKLSYYANVYIVSNPADPSLEGQVKIFRFGAKVFDKIKSAMKPEFEDDPVIDPFDFWGGANFRLRVKQVAGYPNYDDSVFESPSALLNGDDDELEKLWKSEFSLQELISRDKFKSSDDLQKRLNYVLGTSSALSSIREQEDELESLVESTSKEDDIMKELEESYSRIKSTSTQIPVQQEDEDEEDALAYFSKLAE
ncbi:MAG: Synechococcus phage [Bacteroidota bacterium]|jgi:hypothetical protein